MTIQANFASFGCFLSLRHASCASAGRWRSAQLRSGIARHGGALPCTAASLMHFPGGTNLAVLLNLGQDKNGKFLGRGIEGPLTDVVRSVKDWPVATL